MQKRTMPIIYIIIDKVRKKIIISIFYFFLGEGKNYLSYVLLMDDDHFHSGLFAHLFLLLLGSIRPGDTILYIFCSQAIFFFCFFVRCLFWFMWLSLRLVSLFTTIHIPMSGLSVVWFSLEIETQSATKKRSFCTLVTSLMSLMGTWILKSGKL